MREFEPFDPDHPRCKHPVYGANFDKIMMVSGLSAVQVAKAAGISVDVVRGYRRGFYKPSRESEAKLEKVFGVSLTPEAETALQPITPVAISLPEYFKIESAKVEETTGDMLVVFRLPKERVFEMIGGLALSAVGRG